MQLKDKYFNIKILFITNDFEFKMITGLYDSLLLHEHHHKNSIFSTENFDSDLLNASVRCYYCP